MPNFCDHRQLATTVIGRETYRCSVVCLAKESINAACAGCVDDAPSTLLHEVWPHGSCHLICAVEMDIENSFPLCFVHVVERFVPKKASIVDQNVNMTKCLESGINDLDTIFTTCLAGYCYSTCRGNLVDDF